MKLWLITQSETLGYDTYDSAVVAALDEDAARRISPCGFREWDDERGAWMFRFSDGTKRPEENHHSWAQHIDNVSVECIGEATDKIKAGLILASFNAG